MKNLTTPQAILCGFGLVALAIASVPYSSQIVKPAYASNGDEVQKVVICNLTSKLINFTDCANVYDGKLQVGDVNKF